ncbi:MAG: DMT family transporter [Crocinitomicaceae bacterium]|nr:DMT family transporter [Flavobacteriales bacterium]NQZ35159.1 DMT family transporter [Crocinitomicaceae bacterium]
MNKGIVYIVFSGLCFLVVNFFVKILGAGPEQDIIDNVQVYPGHELVLARSIVTFVISWSIIRYRGISMWGVNKKWLLIRSLAGTTALTIFFYTIHHIPLAIAIVVQNLSPIFTVILAMFILKERVRTLQWFFIVMSFFGVALIAYDQLGQGDSNFGEVSFFWLGMGMVSAFISGIAYTAIMKLRTTDSPIVIVMYFPMLAIPLMTILCFFEFTVPQGIEWLILLTIGVFTQFAQIYMTKAFHQGTAAGIIPFKYLSIIYAFLVGYFFFGEKLSWTVDVGIAIVLIGVLSNAFIRARK